MKKSLKLLASLLATIAIFGCSDRAPIESAAGTEEATLTASQYFGTAGEWVMVESAKLEPGTLTIASLNDKYGGDPKSCAKTTRVGTCLVHEACVVPSSPAPPSSKPADVTLTSGPTTITLTANERTFFHYAPTPEPALIPALTNVHASGGGLPGRVPAFELDGTMPTAVAVTSPSYTSRVTVRRGSPFTTTWTGGDRLVNVTLTSSEMKVVVDANGDRGGLQAGPSYTVECLFPASAGWGAIPAAALRNFPLGNGAPEDVVFTAPVGTPYRVINLQVASEGHSLKVGAGQQGVAIAELVTRASNDNTSDVDIVP